MAGPTGPFATALDDGIPRELPGDTTLFSTVARDARGSRRKRPWMRWIDADSKLVAPPYGYSPIIAPRPRRRITTLDHRPFTIIPHNHIEFRLFCVFSMQRHTNRYV